jgi:hypothetical protein
MIIRSFALEIAPINTLGRITNTKLLLQLSGLVNVVKFFIGLIGEIEGVIAIDAD